MKSILIDRQTANSVAGRLRSWHPLLAVICIALLASSCGGGGSRTVTDPGSSADGALSDVLEVARSGHNIPALAAILISDGSIVEMAAVGSRALGEQEAVTAADQWHLGSITKSMSSTLAAVLIERGLLDWDMTVADILLTDVPDMRSEYHDVRLEQLMAHTGGLPVDITLAAAFQNGDVNDTSPLPMTERRFLWAADLLRLAPDASLGTHRYSNANYIVLGAIIENVTGELWEDLMQREIFAALGMIETGFGPPGIAGMRVQPWGHVDQGGNWEPVDPGSNAADNALAIGPAGTVHSTMADFSIYMAAHLAGERGIDGLLLASTFARLHSAQSGTNYAGGWVTNGSGWSGRPSFWHNGSNGRWFAHTVIAPDRNAAVFVATNSGSWAAVEEFIDVMIQRFEAMPN